MNDFAVLLRRRFPNGIVFSRSSIPVTVTAHFACQVNVGFEPRWSKTLGLCFSADQICVRVPLFSNPAYVVALRFQVQLGSHLPLVETTSITHTKRILNHFFKGYVYASEYLSQTVVGQHILATSIMAYACKQNSKLALTPSFAALT
jgi:hypothetical protein